MSSRDSNSTIPDVKLRFRVMQVRLHLNVKLFNGIMMRGFVACMFCIECIINRMLALFALY